MNRLASLRPVLRAARRGPCVASPTANPARVRFASTSGTGNKPPAPSSKKSKPASPEPPKQPAAAAQSSSNVTKTTTTTVTPPSKEFERLLSSLYPGMKAEDLAKRVAVLYMMTDKKNEIEAVEKRLGAVLRGKGPDAYEKVSQRIKHYLKNPPQDILERSEWWFLLFLTGF